MLNNGAEVNQRDPRGLTPLHRAAHLAHLDGYLEIYEYLLVRECLRKQEDPAPGDLTYPPLASCRACLDQDGRHCAGHAEWRCHPRQTICAGNANFLRPCQSAGRRVLLPVTCSPEVPTLPSRQMSWSHTLPQASAQCQQKWPAMTKWGLY